MQNLAYLNTPPEQSAKLKQQCADFVVREDLGYTFTHEGEFVVAYVRKTDANTLFVGEKIARYLGLPNKSMSYAGLKDRQAITEQYFSFHMPGKTLPDLSALVLEGVEILALTRHQRKIRIGSLQGNTFCLLLRQVQYNPKIEQRLHFIALHGVPNYFTEQRFGRDKHNLTQAWRWAKNEILVKDRKKRSFYLSALRSELFNLFVSKRIKLGLTQQICVGDILQLKGSHSVFKVTEQDDLDQLQQRLLNNDVQITAPLIGADFTDHVCLEQWELYQDILQAHQPLLALLEREKLKTHFRPIVIKPHSFHWQFTPEGLQLDFYLTAGSYATALVRELVQIEEDNTNQPK